MTVKEKRDAIRIHCGKYNSDCTGCVLLTVPRSGLGGCHSHASDKEIERNYEMIFGRDTTPVNTCVACGAEIPEGRQYCPDCLTLPISESNPVTGDPIKPTYYNDTKITPFDVIDDWGLNFYLGNAVKYIKRAGKKAGNSRLQDLKKIREYIDHEIRAEEE